MHHPSPGDVFVFFWRVALAVDFIVPIYLQVLLLHPSIPDKWSRPLRAGLMVPAVALSALAPFRHAVVPVEHAISANFRWGIFGPYFVLRSIEFGLVKDRSIYTWIGFNAESPPPTPPIQKGDEGASSGTASNGHSELRKRVNGDHINGPSSAYNVRSGIDSGYSTPPIEPGPMQEPSAGDKGRAAVVKEKEYQQEARAPTPGWLTLLSDSFHLLGAMRGIGYACGPPRKSLARPIRGHLNFLVDAFKNLVVSHIIGTFCLGLMLHRRDWVPALIPLPLKLAEPLGEVIGFLAVGISLHAQMVMGFSGLSMVYWIAQEGGRRVIPAPFTPSEFDEREWPPLFRRPWAPVNVGTFWGQQWHSLFRTPFTVVGYNPVVKVFTPVLGKQLGRIAGAVAVFVLSGWMHDQALISARYPIASVHLRPLSFSERWGGWIFFMWQAVAVVLEGVFISVTRKKLKGTGATLWSYFCIVAVGTLAGRAWLAQGLVDGLPGMDRWNWRRFVVPTVAMAPPPLWTH